VVGLRIATNNFMHVFVPPLFGALGSLTGIALVFWASGVVLSLGAYASRLAPPIAPAIAPTIKPAAKDK